jgi:hypothetical protein
VDSDFSLVLVEKMNRILELYLRECYSIFYYRLFSGALAIRNNAQDSILGRIYSRVRGWSNVYNVQVKDGKYTLILPGLYARIQANELRLWSKWYGDDFKGKIVLDVGAGAGETASFFFNRGAEKVIAVESNPEAIDCLYDNIVRNDWNCEILEGEFKLSDLEIPHDYLKMDIEGGEIALLNYTGELGKASLELHPERIGKENCQKLIEKFNLKALMRPRVYAS